MLRGVLRDQTTPPLPSISRISERVEYIEREAPSLVFPANWPSPVSLCPMCQRAGFHSALFDLSWVRQCPIHEQTLLDYCPDCKESLPPLSVLPHRKCTTCAYGAFYRDRISAPQFRHLKVIAEMVTIRDKPWHIIDKHDSVSHWRQCDVNDERFPSFRVTQCGIRCHNDLERLGVSISQVERLQWPIKRLNKPIISDTYRVKGWQAKERYGVFIEACRAIDAASEVSYICTSEDLRRIDTLGVEAPPKCFVSLALFMWLDLVCAADDTYTHRLDLSRYAIFYDLKVAYAFDVPVKSRYRENDKSWELPTSFRQWAYRQDLVRTFNQVIEVALLLSTYFRACNKDRFAATDDLRKALFSLDRWSESVYLYRIDNILHGLLLRPGQLNTTKLRSLCCLSQPISLDVMGESPVLEISTHGVDLATYRSIEDQVFALI